MERGPKGASDRVVSDRKRIYIYKYIYIIEERLISDAHLLLVSVLHGCKKKIIRDCEGVGTYQLCVGTCLSNRIQDAYC